MVEDTPQAESQAEPATEQPRNCPSEALYMDFETAMHCAKALFAAIAELEMGGATDRHVDIVSLARIGESIIQDQLDAESNQ